MSLREELEKMVTLHERIGYPALMERFVLRNGKAMPWRKRIGPPRTPKECFQNASQFVDRAGTGVYTEGYVLRPDLFPIHHAWVSIDGEAMDPTLRDCETCQYFGVEFTNEERYAEQLKNRVYGLLDHGLGLNHELMFRRDRELQAIVEGVMQVKA